MAKKSLVIVESSTKARTINRYLGKGYRVEASVGHVRDLPKKKLGVDIENGFEPTYRTIQGQGKTLNKLRQAAKNADSVYLAPDPDREGEAIAWHLVEALKLPEDKAFRVTFNEITGRAVRDAFEHPRKIDMARVNAQQARRVLDRIVGYQLSPLLWKKVAKGLSAGRVQSVAVRLIVEREKEIRAFEPEEYWKIAAILSPEGGGEDQAFEAQLLKWAGKKFRPGNETDARAVAEALESAAFIVDQVKQKRQKQSPGPPFNTSLLQQTASSRLRFSASRTMRVAQQLYEGVDIGPEGAVGLITYMRTDSFRLAGSAVEECRRLIPKAYGEDYLPPKPRFYKSRKGAQEAHEAVRPTDVNRTPEQLKPHLSRDQYRLYKLIWDRFVASQMADARYLATRVDITAAEGSFRATGRVCTFPGHTRVWPRKDKDQQDLPELSDGQRLDLLKLEPTQHFTEPPRRYSEASLIRTLERQGIGRPSTYAPIIATIQERGYVNQIKRAFHATDLGIVVTDLLVAGFPDIMDIEFTSEMEDKLDLIEEEGRDWRSVLDEFYKLFKADLEKAEKELDKVKGIQTGESCPECGEPLVERWSRHGRFVGCSGYPDCRYIQRDDEDEGEETDFPCDKCGEKMVIKTGRHGKFFACSAYPECKNTRPIGRDGKPVPPPEPTDEVCEKCGSQMVIKTGRRGKFIACSGFPKCRNTKPLPTGVKCPEEGCDGELVYRRGRGRKKGFYGCTNHPKCEYRTSKLPEKTGSSED